MTTLEALCCGALGAIVYAVAEPVCVQLLDWLRLWRTRRYVRRHPESVIRRERITARPGRSYVRPEFFLEEETPPPPTEVNRAPLAP